MTYGSVPLAPCIFMDDVIHGAVGVEEARQANVRIDMVVSQLNLNLNQDKTVCICIGSPKQISSVKNDLEANPLMCGNFETKLKQKFKWLGQILSCKGLADSATETVSGREGKIRGACLEIAKIVNDWRSQVPGGMATAILLWEACCIPSLLNGSGTWTEIQRQLRRDLTKYNVGI